MAIGVIFNGSDMTPEQYLQIFNEATNGGTEWAPGLLSHHAGPKEGGFCIIETWESSDHLAAFFEAKLGQAVANAGVQAQPTLFEITNSI